MITYSSTTLANVSDGASNLSPFFSHKLTDIYNAENNPNGYWMDNGTSYGWTKNSKFTFTQLEDGWLHVHIDNNSGTATIRNDCCVPKYNPSIKRATKYTFLAEFRNNQSTGAASGADFYLVQQSGSVQFWGQNVSTAPLVHLEGIGSVTVPISEIPSDGSYAFSRFTKYSEPEGESSHWTANEKMVTFTFRANAGAVLDYDIRLSVYEGEYWGNYIPYVISDITDVRKFAETANDRAEEANNKIDNLEIGGRNLILDTAQERISPASASGSAYVSPTPMCSAYADSILNNIEDEFVYSFDYEVTGNTATDGYVYTQIRGTQTANTDGKVSINIYNNPVGKYSHVFKLSSSQASGTSLSAGIRLRYASDGAILIVRNIKLEKGNKATDWIPAPEDTQADIDTALAQSIWYATCSDAGATKSATITPATTNFVLNVGTTVNVKFNNTNTGAVGSLTLNINNTGAKNIKYIYNKTLNNLPAADYITAGSTYLFVYDGTYWVIQNMNYNTNETNHILNNFSGKTGELGIWQTGLFMKDGEGTYQNICTDSSGNITRTNANTKKANPNGFEVGSSIYLSPSNTYAANVNITGSVYASYGAFDSRYNLNTTLTAGSLTPYIPVYLIGTINDIDGLFYLDTVWWTQTPTDPDKVYVLVGGCYDSTTSYCRITLYEQNNWYKYVDGALVDYSNNLAELAATTATAFIAVDTDNNGIMIHPEDDMASGWQIGDAIQLFKNGISYIRMWIQDNIPKIRIGDEDKNHIVIDDEAIRFYGEDSNDETKELATYSTDGITFDPETSYKIGNNNSYISFEDEDNNKKLKIVADSIEFTSTGDIQKQLDDLQGNLDLRDQYIKIDTGDTEAIPPVLPSITIAASLDGEATNLKLESDKLSFQVNGQPTATMTNDKMNIPTASVTNLFMESSGHQKIWVIRENGHLSLKAGKIME